MTVLEQEVRRVIAELETDLCYYETVETGYYVSNQNYGRTLAYQDAIKKLKEIVGA